MSKDILFSIADNFVLEGRPKTIEPTGHGHINNTYLVVTDLNKRYILQRISDAFDIKSLMKNIDAVTSFMALKSENPERQMRLIHTKRIRIILRMRREITVFSLSLRIVFV